LKGRNKAVHIIQTRFHRRARLAALGGAIFGILGFLGPRPAAAAPATRVRFQLRAECDCASCGFALQSELRKLPGVTRVDLATRERRVTVAFDESRLALPRLAAAVAGTDLGKHSALIADLTESRTTPDLAPLARVPGVRATALDAKHHCLLIELGDDAPATTSALAGALAEAGVSVRFEPSTTKK
jgi:hypothetical protein